MPAGICKKVLEKFKQGNQMAFCANSRMIFRQIFQKIPECRIVAVLINPEEALLHGVFVDIDLAGKTAAPVFQILQQFPMNIRRIQRRTWKGIKLQRSIQFMSLAFLFFFRELLSPRLARLAKDIIQHTFSGDSEGC